MNGQNKLNDISEIETKTSLLFKSNRKHITNDEKSGAKMKLQKIQTQTQN